MPGLTDWLKERFPSDVLETHAAHGDETAVVTRASLPVIAAHVKQDPAFDMNVLVDITAVDGLTMKWNPRFEAVYHFLKRHLPSDHKTLRDFRALFRAQSAVFH